MIRMYEKQTAFTARQVLAVIIALILMSDFLPSQAAVAEDEPFIEIEDLEWDDCLAKHQTAYALTVAKVLVRLSVFVNQPCRHCQYILIRSGLNSFRLAEYDQQISEEVARWVY